jgi:hypothetical protein
MSLECERHFVERQVNRLLFAVGSPKAASALSWRSAEGATKSPNWQVFTHSRPTIDLFSDSESAWPVRNVSTGATMWGVQIFSARAPKEFACTQKTIL